MPSGRSRAMATNGITEVGVKNGLDSNAVSMVQAFLKQHPDVRFIRA